MTRVSEQPVQATTVARERGGVATDPAARRDVVAAAIEPLLTPARDSLSSADRILLVPDAHYPYHHSTGMVTDPAVVEALLEQLTAWTDANLSIGATSERLPLERTLEYLGYPTDGPPIVDLQDAEMSWVEVPTANGERRPHPVPVPLLEQAVVVVPTLRPTANGRLAGTMATLDRVTRADGDQSPLSALRAVEPAVSILDATTAFAGRPHALNALVAGPPAQVDAVGTWLLKRDLGDEPGLADAVGKPPTVTWVGESANGASLESLRAALPAGDLPPSDEPNPAVKAAYRLYADVSGDVVPPQLEVDPR